MNATIVITWLPIVALPAAVIWLTPADWPRWVFMWMFAFAIFAGCKWLTWRTTPAGAPWPRQAGYLFAWPGMDAPSFLYAASRRAPTAGAWGFALAKLGLGLVLCLGIVPRLPASMELLRGWVGMVGIVFVLHFGLFHLLSLAWQAGGVDAKPLMDWPIRATSVSEFWGMRWNTAFRDLTHRYLFRPLAIRVGARWALALGFLVSGTVHDLVISLPAGGGYGGPTAFFLIQAGAIFLERSPIGKRLGLGHGMRGWVFTMLVLVGPLGLLFHPAFVRTIVTPFVSGAWLE